MKTYKFPIFFGLLLINAIFMVYAKSSHAATAAEINRDAKQALEQLYSESPSAKVMGEKAKAILVFPDIVKGGFIVGGQYGEGAMFINGKVSGHYNTVQASWGLQAGVKKYAYVLFLMSEDTLNWVNKSDGWEVGIGPSITVVDVGAAKSATTTTLQSDIYAFFFNPRGLMGGLGLQGTKITKIEK